jgi:hypothetical protein
MPFPSEGTTALVDEDSLELHGRDQASNEGALNLFENFLEGIVSAALTSTVEAEETPAPPKIHNRQSSRLQVQDGAAEDLSATVMDAPIPKKVSFCPPYPNASATPFFLKPYLRYAVLQTRVPSSQLRWP